jgi:hypothetical protein
MEKKKKKYYGNRGGRSAEMVAAGAAVGLNIGSQKGILGKNPMAKETVQSQSLRCKVVLLALLRPRGKKER